MVDLLLAAAAAVVLKFHPHRHKYRLLLDVLMELYFKRFKK
jgi:hypothetical protein